MDKKLAIQLLGGSPTKAAEAMGYKSRQAVYMWPDVLPQPLADKVNGALQRIKSAKRGRRQSVATEAA